ncbi:hypothetical protein [Nonomuraea candida]|uniref:hypothetical protein n=1 Tax=Nonomuraea candida TaxID=359159 RepID=UPI0005B830D0|nr:hypothetical protein [Nonomuraea candida]
MSAIVLALGLTGVGAAPFITQSASASAARLDPVVEPCDADVSLCTDITPETTITVTTTLGSPSPTGPEEAPETTVTKTVTATPTKTSKPPSPTPTKTSTPPPVPETTPTQNPQPLPTQSVEVPPVTSTTPTPEQSVEMPTIAPTEAATTPQPSETQVASTEEVLELRKAAPEFDQTELTRKLSIPALVLVLLALFAVLIFEGRLRRMAHAAAVRRAGPQHAGPLGAQPTAPMGPRPDLPPHGGGYPAGPGYAASGFPAPPTYPGGTAYAPIISFVPVQTYPSGPPQYGYQDPNHPYPPQGYMQEPGVHGEAPPEPVVLHPDEFDSYSEPPRPAGEPARERDLFEPLVPPSPPPADIPPGGAEPYDGGLDQPLGPASAAEPGDSEPWEQGEPGSLFRPAVPRDPNAPRDYEPPPYLPADGDVTAVQPLPPQPAPQEASQEASQKASQEASQEARQPEDGPREPTKEMPDPKRRRFGRKK